MINEANEPSSACHPGRVHQVETSTPPIREDVVRLPSKPLQVNGFLGPCPGLACLGLGMGRGNREKIARRTGSGGHELRDSPRLGHLLGEHPGNGENGIPLRQALQESNHGWVRQGVDGLGRPGIPKGYEGRVWGMADLSGIFQEQAAVE